MLQLGQTVPDSLLLDRAANDLKTVMAKQNAHWLHVSAEMLGVSPESEYGIEWIQSQTSKARATPTKPNTGNSVYTLTGDTLEVAFQPNTHCGFSIPYSSELGTEYSFAIRFSAPEKDGRTLLTLNPDSVNNYLFLSQNNDAFLFKDQRTTAEIETTTEVDSEQPCLLVAGQSEGTLYLRIETGPIITSSDVSESLAMQPSGELFIGCRSNRNGLVKTLGGFGLRDVFFWPDLNILETTHSDTLSAIDEYCMWEI